MESEGRGDREQYHLHVESERERIPVAFVHFTAMIGLLSEARREQDADIKKDFQARALVRAVGLLTRPYEERERVAQAFGKLMGDNQSLAKDSIRVLRAARVLKEIALRRYLDLPVRGRLFPRK